MIYRLLFTVYMIQSVNMFGLTRIGARLGRVWVRVGKLHPRIYARGLLPMLDRSASAEDD